MAPQESNPYERAARQWPFTIHTWKDDGRGLTSATTRSIGNEITFRIFLFGRRCPAIRAFVVRAGDNRNAILGGLGTAALIPTGSPAFAEDLSDVEAGPLDPDGTGRFAGESRGSTVRLRQTGKAISSICLIEFGGRRGLQGTPIDLNSRQLQRNQHRHGRTQDSNLR